MPKIPVMHRPKANSLGAHKTQYYGAPCYGAVDRPQGPPEHTVPIGAKRAYIIVDLASFSRP